VSTAEEHDDDDDALEELERRLAVLRERQFAKRFKRDTQEPWHESVAPNDRERELALRTMNQDNRGDCSVAVLMTSFARALAAYRVELTVQPQQTKGT
jgi:hypothetical protein